MDNFVKYLPTIVAALGGAATVFTPMIQDMISAHPNVATGLAAAYAILAHFLPSPRS